MLVARGSPTVRLRVLLLLPEAAVSVTAESGHRRELTSAARNSSITTPSRVDLVQASFDLTLRDGLLIRIPIDALRVI